MAKKAEKAKAAKKAAKQQRKSAMAKKSLTKVKKKKWVPIFAPPFFGEQLIGECFVIEAEDLLNRRIKVSIANLTKEMRRQAQSVTFQAIKPKGNGVISSIVGFELSLPSIKRLVRKSRTKVSDSFLIKLKDEKVARVKPFIIVRQKIPNSLQTKLRLKARALLAREAQNMTFQKFMEDVIQGKVQKLMKVTLQKSHPLSACEMRMVKLERADTPLELGDVKMEIPKRTRRPRRFEKRDEKKEAQKAKPAEKKEEKVEEKAEKPKAEVKPEEPKAEAKPKEAEA
ncbi:MAG: hypothetical protein ACE5FT_00370 [Candidatus Nanoarchaeia archaeon]